MAKALVPSLHSKPEGLVLPHAMPAGSLRHLVGMWVEELARVIARDPEGSNREKDVPSSLPTLIPSREATNNHWLDLELHNDICILIINLYYISPL